MNTSLERSVPMSPMKQMVDSMTSQSPVMTSQSPSMTSQITQMQQRQMRIGQNVVSPQQQMTSQSPFMQQKSPQMTAPSPGNHHPSNQVARGQMMTQGARGYQQGIPQQQGGEFPQVSAAEMMRRGLNCSFISFNFFKRIFLTCFLAILVRLIKRC